MTPWNHADYSPMISVKNIEKFFYSKKSLVFTIGRKKILILQLIIILIFLNQKKI